MPSEAIETIQELASRFRDEERNLVLHFPDLDTPPAADSYNRVFGPPVGLTEEHWPTFPELGELLQQANCVSQWDRRDTRMEHVFTIDLRGIDLLGAPAGAEAMMLFLSNASFHRACREDSPHTSVMFLDRSQLRRGTYQGHLPKRSLYRWSRRFSLVPIAVPGEVFDVPNLDLLPDDLLVELFEAIRQAPARLGGCPITVNGPARIVGGWEESSPTLPRDEPRPKIAAPSPNLTMAYEAVSSSRRPRRAPRNLTMPYRALQSDPAVAFAAEDFESRRTLVPRSEPSPFLMQFQRRFADVNLGREGVMYVSGRGAYVPSH